MFLVREEFYYGYDPNVNEITEQEEYDRHSHGFDDFLFVGAQYNGTIYELQDLDYQIQYSDYGVTIVDKIEEL